MAAREVIERKERKDDDAIRVHESRKGAACVFEKQKREGGNDGQQLRNLNVKPGCVRTQQEQYKFDGYKNCNVNLVRTRKSFKLV